MSAGLVELAAGPARLTLAPAIGGAVARFAIAGADILRPASPAALAAGDVLGMASFPLVPFAGRIGGSSFGFGGRAVSLPANLPPEADAIHGQGWRAPWSVAEAGGGFARLTLDHAPDAWPWAWRAEQTFTLGEAGLEHRLKVTNLDSRPMPAGLGLHPYFPRPGGARLTARVDGVFLRPDQAPSPPPADWDWRLGPAIGPLVDHQFAGFDGAARLDWPDLGRALSLTTEPAAPWLVVYVPPGEAWFCVEPVSHQLNAVNLSEGGAGHGMKILGPGESLAITMRLELASPPPGDAGWRA